MNADDSVIGRFEVFRTLTYPNIRRISIAALRRNFRTLQAALPDGAMMLAVLKADAYGHGLLQTARALAQEGASMFGVAAVDEGLALREGGITLPILMLGPVTPDGLALAVSHGVTLTVCSPEMVLMAEQAAAELSMQADVHIKLDTGMNRIGCRDEAELAAVLSALERAPHVRLTGAFTHFADADNAVLDFTRMQLDRFRSMIRLLPENILLHCANSAALLALPESSFQMVRAGVALYGYPPVRTALSLEPCMTWETAVTYVKDVRPGDCISYGCAYTVQSPMRVATIACGYGDGYHRAASGKAEVLIRGVRCPVVGRICMDQMMADVTHVPGAAPGDRVVLMGEMDGERITAADIARWAGTIPYEILLGATGRVRRIWTDE